jgi:hypothetical protein
MEQPEEIIQPINEKEQLKQPDERFGTIFHNRKMFTIILKEKQQLCDNKIYNPSILQNGCIALSNGNLIEIILEHKYYDQYDVEFKEWLVNFAHEQKALFTMSNKLKNDFRRYTAKPWDENNCKYRGTINYCLNSQGHLADVYIKRQL